MSVSSREIEYGREKKRETYIYRERGNKARLRERGNKARLRGREILAEREKHREMVR